MIAADGYKPRRAESLRLHEGSIARKHQGELQAALFRLLQGHLIGALASLHRQVQVAQLLPAAHKEMRRTTARQIRPQLRRAGLRIYLQALGFRDTYNPVDRQHFLHLAALGIGTAGHHFVSLVAPVGDFHRQRHTQLTSGRHNHLAAPEHLLRLPDIAQTIGPGKRLFVIIHHLNQHSLFARQNLVRARIIEPDSVSLQVHVEISRMNRHRRVRHLHILLAVIDHAAGNTDTARLPHLIRHGPREHGLALGIQRQVMMRAAHLQLATCTAQRGTTVIHCRNTCSELSRRHRVHLHIEHGLESIAPEHLAIGIG